ncbi:MAG: hypothetical protein WD768_16460, partial [Phycisphaeraceae bacterium]
MRRFSFSLLALLLTLLTSNARAAEVGFIEDYALAADRAEALKQLIPGTDDFYYYHALNHQSIEQFEKVNETLAAWRKHYPNTNYPQTYWEIVDRQSLLTYSKNPDDTLKHLRQRLNLHFNHNRETLNQKPNYPTALNEGLITRDTLTKNAWNRHGQTGGFEDRALDWLITTDLNDDRRRELLSRLQRPDYANLVNLVVADLRYKYSGGFGSLNIHRIMLLDQLEALAKQMPELLKNTNYVNTYITRLQPNPDIDWRNDPKEYAAYLDRLWSFVKDLAPAFNSLKGHVLYHRMAFDRQQGEYSRARFKEYIELPKYVSYINNKYMQLEDNRRYPCDLNANYQPVTLLPIVGNDEPLIRSYLHNFFEKDTGYAAYETYINDIYLKHNFAEVKITRGLGDAEQWARLIPPALYQQIKDRVDLEFEYTNDEQFSVEEKVSLDVYVKNVKTLLVKVYEVNAANFYRDNLREVDTDINLDGLVPNKQTTIDYTEAPAHRVKRHFEFGELSSAGVYVIDFIGNGKSSRVLVRKGKLRFLERISTAGHIFKVMNEKNEHLKTASLWLAGHEYKADKDGLIAVPFSNRGGRTPIVLSNAGFTSLEHFDHANESYQLLAGIHVDREQLIKRKKANVLIRAGLYLNGTPVTLSVLEDVRLVINSQDHDGIVSTKEVTGFKLYEDRDAVYEFSVPDRLQRLTFTIAAKVQNLSTGQKNNVAANAQYVLNQIDTTDKVEDLHLADMGGLWVIDLFGKTGEARTDRPVNVVLKHRDFRDTIHVTLQTDEAGRIRLGKLDGIDWVQAQGPEGTSHQWPLPRDERSYQASVHAKAGSPVLVPFLGDAKQPQRADISLLSLRGGVFHEDHFKSVTLANGYLKLDDLPRGDYDLLLKDSGQRIQVRLTEGEAKDNYVVSDYRQLEVRNASPLHIESIAADAKDITVKLGNANKYTRVHVFVTRMRPEYSPWNSLNNIGDPNPSMTLLTKQKSAYVAGRNIGDEYRYILERKYMKIYPGNMLTRPGILLNPWAIRTTETGEQIAQGGDFFGQAGGEGGGKAFKSGFFGSGGDDRRNQAGVGFANLDFLGETSAVLLNLTPDKNGVITIKREEIGDRQHVHVIAVDPQNTIYRSLALAEPKSEFVDLRLRNGLDPKQHFTEQKQISIVRKGDKFVIGDITTSKFEIYDTLARTYALYATLSGNGHLVEFSFLLNWPNLKPEEKQAKYSEYACHEMNLFLLHKDPEFFQKVVLPYIANKRDKTFIDQWLLGNASAHYLEPWEYQRLNIAERILLSQKLAGEQPTTARHVKDLFDLIPPNMDQFNHLFQTALKGSALDAGDDYGLAEQLEKQMPSEKLQSELRRDLGNATPSPAAPPMVTASPRPGNAPAGPGRGAAKADSAPADAKLADEAKKESSGRYREEAERDYAGKNMERLKQLSKDRAAQSGEKAQEFGYHEADADRRKLVRQFYRKLDKTQEWVENNYYKLPIHQQDANLISVNGYWVDYAKANPKQPFLSTNLAESSRNFPDMMFALATLDLPFEAGKHDVKYDGSKMTLTADSALVVYHKEIKPAPTVAKQTPILVSQNFFRHNDRYRHENNERMDKYVTDEFLVHTVYGCQVVITNPTSSTQKLDILLQVPQGAMPVLNGQFTRGVHLQLQPFNTQAIEYYFYFPGSGKYPHYPVHVAKNEEAIAFAEPFTFNVVKELSKIDKGSWDYISQFGTDDQVYAYLQENNLHRTNLDKIAFRMKDKAFFERVIVLITQRHAYNHTLYSYGIVHNEPGVIQEFLQHSDQFVANLGQWLDSPLLVIDPVERKSFEFMEYKPLVNARAHQLGKRRNIVNDRLAWQYHRQLKVVSYKRKMDDNDLLAVTYYMLLQDRIEESLEYFAMAN